MADQLDSEGRPKRRRLKTSRFDFETLDNSDIVLIRQAMKNSKRETKRIQVAASVPTAPTYYPTEEEFKDPLVYINSIRLEAQEYGICKIIPPAAWNPPDCINFEDSKLFPTKLQTIETLQEGQGFDDGRVYDIAGYKEMADLFRKDWELHNYDQTQPASYESLEQDYWDIIETGVKKATVEYANDLDTTLLWSGFPKRQEKIEGEDVTRMLDDMTDPKYYTYSNWNLNNIAHAPGSVLSKVKTPINGINVPWLYMGMLFATFCWHNEDNYLYSINYSHFGEPKQWYGVPGHYAKQFEKVSKDFLLESFKDSPDLLHHMTLQISLSRLVASQIPVYSLMQEPKSFIVTFPKAFHGGFSYGFNCNEAVNFASPDWIRFGSEAEERYRLFARPSVFSHIRLLFTLIENDSELSEGSRKIVSDQVIAFIDEELIHRPSILSQGVRDISTMVNLPANNFRLIDEKASDYDEKRLCHICKQVCVFTAIACECSQSKVACMRHFSFLCKCEDPETKKTKKYMLAWGNRDEMLALRRRAQILGK